MSSNQESTLDTGMLPRLRENIWHIEPSSKIAFVITSQATFEISTDAALEFLAMRSYCTGHYSPEEISQKSGLPLEEVTRILSSLEKAGILRTYSNPDRKISLGYVREALVNACRIWSNELRYTYIGNEFALGMLPRTVLIGWLIEMYHYIKDFPYAIEHGASRAKGRLRDVLIKYSDEERGHEEFVLQTLMNLGLSRKEVQTSAPLLSTRMIGFLMRELFELEPASTLMVAALLEAQEFNEEQIQQFKQKLQEHYEINPKVFDPYFRHQQIDVGLGHAELLASNLDLIDIDDLQKLDEVVNKIHDLKHAFDLQGLEIKSYFTTLNGKYFPRQRVDFLSI